MEKFVWKQMIFYYNGSDTNYSGTAFQNGYAAYSKNEEFFI